MMTRQMSGSRLVRIRRRFLRGETVNHCTTWTQYCRSLGYSERHIDRLISGRNPATAKHDGSRNRTTASIPKPDLRRLAAFVRDVAQQNFEREPGKCFQRHMREVWARLYPDDMPGNLTGARVIRISNATAAKIIQQYEWLGTMGAGTIASYGLALQGKLIGCVCFSKNGSPQALRDSGADVCLVRGACVPHAPKNAASFLISRACRIASKEFGWTRFLAYSDEDAGERGVIYRACNWQCLGRAKQGAKKRFISPDGRTIFSSYQFNKVYEPKFIALGWDGKEAKYDFLRRIGFVEQVVPIKIRWVWQERRRHEPLPIRERSRHDQLRRVPSAVSVNGPNW